MAKELIDRHELCEAIERQLNADDSTKSAVRAIAHQIPAVDAVPVVRCKDCKHGVWNEEEQLWQCVYSAELDEGIGEYFGFFEYNEGEHFCSRGERKDNE